MSDSGIKEGLTPTEVASFLRRHPEFLQDYPDLALTLAPPREQGATTSLASYQLEVLRDKNRELGRRLHELVNNASENEQLVQRVHALTIALMRESTLAGSVRRVVGSLREDFHTDHVRLVMFRADPELPAADWLIVQWIDLVGTLEDGGSAFLGAVAAQCRRSGGRPTGRHACDRQRRREPLPSGHGDAVRQADRRRRGERVRSLRAQVTDVPPWMPAYTGST